MNTVLTTVSRLTSLEVPYTPCLSMFLKINYELVIINCRLAEIKHYFDPRPIQHSLLLLYTMHTADQKITIKSFVNTVPTTISRLTSLQVPHRTCFGVFLKTNYELLIIVFGFGEPYHFCDQSVIKHSLCYYCTPCTGLIIRLLLKVL